jgi:hypothetical protein
MGISAVSAGSIAAADDELRDGRIASAKIYREGSAELA